MINSLQCDLAEGVCESKFGMPIFCTQWQLFIRRLVEHASHAFPLNFTDHVKFDCENLISIMLIDILNSLINHGNSMDALYVIANEGIQTLLCSSAQLSSDFLYCENSFVFIVRTSELCDNFEF